jgi:DNA (cytosine-5)-methyltransferase 1
LTGGFTLGLEQAGFKFDHVQYSEVDKYAIQVYQHRFKEAEYVGSVTDVHGKRGQADIITFGSPCQDFSIAGKRAGMGGERSSLISHAIRLITEIQPKFFIWENVKGTFSSNDGADFWAIIQAFANIGGYRLEWQLLNTSWFLPQNRERIYLVGSLGAGSGRQIFPIREEVRLSGRDRPDAEKQIASCIQSGGESHIANREYKGMNLVDVGTWRTQKGVVCSLDSDGWEKRHESIRRVHGIGGNAPAIPTGTGGGVMTKILVPEPTKKGYTEANEGDSINLSNPNSETRRGRVGVGVAQTLDTACNQGVVQRHPLKFLDRNQKNIEGDYSFTVDSMNTGGVKIDSRIRRLTPLECERLQGFPDNWTAIGTGGEISDTQRYKMCGNAVSVPVVAAVGKRILDIH